MIEHPIPQNVTGYQFHLVGDMTLKQFLEFAGGAVFALLIWKLSLPVLIKIPLAFLSIITGVSLAFMPIEERPLDKWIFAFFKAIYRPTLFTWKKSKRENISEFTPHQTEGQETIEAVAKAPSAGLKTLLEAYELQSLAQPAKDPLENIWQNRQKNFSKLFDEVKVPVHLAQNTTFPQVRNKPILSKPATQPSLHALSLPDNPAAILRGEITLPPRNPSLSKTRPISIPASKPTPRAGRPDQPKTTGLSSTVALPASSPTRADHQPTASAVTNSALPMPATPDIPNILSGMVLTKSGQIVDGAIIEIREQNKLPLRAIKTNKLGQFTISTPLPDGTYELETEKDPLRFDILEIETKGEIIPPIEIRAKN